MRTFLTLLFAVGIINTIGLAQTSSNAGSVKPPNIVLFFIDDLGYADIGPFGATAYQTPNLDRMAREGRKFTDFIVSSAVCSASRAALMTGCIHERVGIRGALGPQAKIGISDRETTIAELCKQKGYSTAIFGKWHLGSRPQFLPTQHGFDRYYGLPYSNDMWPKHPDLLKLPADTAARKSTYPPLPLYDDDRVAVAEVTEKEQAQLTKQYTEQAIAFIEQNQSKPFFVYMPHTMVHVPLFASESFSGKTGKGTFADVMTEVDWSVGQILDTLSRLKLDENTLVLFTSDNGPWLSYGDHAGSALPLREGKGTSWEGGIRVPTLARWPGKIPAGTECKQLASTIDVLPTVAGLIGSPLPPLKIDGKDISPLLFGDESDKSPHQSIPCYYANNELQALRTDRWKLMFAHTSRTLAGKPGGTGGIPNPYQSEKVLPALYDLEADIGETIDVSSKYPEVVQELSTLADTWREALGDSLTKRTGTEIRPAGKIE